MKYLKNFKTFQEYNYKSGGLIVPSISLVNDEQLELRKIMWGRKDDFKKKYLTFTARENCVFKIKAYIYVTQSEEIFSITSNERESFSYSLDDGETWTTYEIPENGYNSDTDIITISVNKGQRVLWKGIGTANCGVADEHDELCEQHCKFESSNYFDVSGNIMSLIYGDNFENKTSLYNTYRIFYNLFSTCSNLIHAHNLVLPATSLSSYCYYNMFKGCSSLITAPELPATSLSSYCYHYMFSGCSSLITAPTLPATSLAQYCYSNMFYGCSSLTTAPAILPATIIASSCYGSMFKGCSSLTTAPELPATTLAYGCYSNMFDRCTSLTTAPELPATTLASGCYASMFDGCTSLTKAPDLLATTLVSNCYRYMFDGCTNLNYIRALFTTTPTNTSESSYTYKWVRNVSPTGTFVKNNQANWNIVSEHAIPSGWTVQIEVTDQNLSIWIDDFNDDDIGSNGEEYDGISIDSWVDTYANDDSNNNYIYEGETIDIDGVTYYLWYATDESISSGSPPYLITTSVNYNTLLSESIYDTYDFETECPHLYACLNDDTSIYFLMEDEPQKLVRVEVIE